MEKIEKLISEKTKEVNSLKPKHYLIKGYLSTFLSLQLPLNIIPFIYFIIFMWIIDYENLGLLKNIFYYTEIITLLLAKKFNFSLISVNKQFKIDKYQSALYELSVLKEKKKILDKANNIKNTI